MALSSGICTAFMTLRTPSFLNPNFSSSMLVASPPTTLRMTRAVTCATAPSQERRPRGIMKPRRVSPEMADVVGASEIARTQALKVIWAHIKANNLQDPQDKKIIICDEKLKKIFDNRDRVGFLEVAKLISPHFLKVE
ncbi:SWIB/MDM2 domain superfamily protein [Euphorbia peplus]|nr:SWIB/MDM2 domain superfamily protein [Euphorbia peplus]